jgi:cysteine-rich repeat protein
VVGLADGDRDGLSDPFDNCPDIANAEQADGDGDGIGDACDLQTCGNGMLEVDEGCDDGNLLGGDGCDADCQIRCATTPMVGCRTPAAAGKASLLLKNANGDTKDALLWKWSNGAQTEVADFGDPRVSEEYALCLYGASGLLTSAAAPAGGTCTGKSCWRASGTKGFKYRDQARTPDGIEQLVLKAGAAGKAKALAKARGVALSLPPMPVMLPIRMQLQTSSGACWEAAYTTALRNDSAQFNAKAD